MDKPSSHITATRTPTALLRPIAAIALLLLAAQFLEGMLVNLFVTVPAVHPGANASNYFLGVVQGVMWALSQGTMYLLIHVAIGWLLFLLALILIWVGNCIQTASVDHYLNSGVDRHSWRWL
jgi:hypothetical protein